MKINAKDRKIQILYSIINICFLLCIDFFILKYAYYSSNSWWVELGKRKLIILIVVNILFLLMLIKQNDWKQKYQKSILVKVLNVLSFVLGPVLNFYILQRIISDDGQFIVQTEYIIKNIIVCYVIYILFLILYRRVSHALILYTLLFVILGLTDYFVTLFRGNAFVLMDVFNIGTATTVAGNYVFALPTKVGLCLIVLLLFVTYQEIFQSIEIGKRSVENYTVRSVVLIVALVCIHKGGEVYLTETVEMWYTSTEYQTKGYPYELACEIQYVEVKKPKGYSVERVEEIADNVQENTEIKTIVPQNIIIIMNESLADFEESGNLKTSTEILSNIHSLKENTKKGYLYVPSFGGGTADSEYEVLTGNTKEFLPQGAIAYQLYCRNPEYGIANTLEKETYSTVALHPFYRRGWNRSSVYSDMNFEEFFSLENWDDELNYVRWYATDQSTFKKITDFCFERKNEKNFLFCVTIQNHGGYTESENAGFESDVSLNYDEEYPLAEVYLSLAKKSDEAFGELINYFKNVEEPTMVVMFGDHWPNLERGFLTEMLGQDAYDLDLLGLQKCRRTPYIIWTNYPSKSGNEDMSTNYFGSYIMENAGIDMPVYNKFLLQLKQALPIIGSGAVCDNNGNWYPIDELPEEYDKLLDEYRILQYNNVIDRKNRISNIFQIEN